VLRAAHPGWTLLIGCTSLFSLYLRSQRWRVLLRPLGAIPLEPALSATMIGFGAATVLPLRLGEFVRPALLARRTRIGFGAAVSSVVLERLFDMLLILSAFLVVGLAYDVPDLLRRGAKVLAVCGAGGIVVLLVMLRRREATEALLARALPAAVVRVVMPVLHGLLSGLAGLGDVRTFLYVLTSSVVLWGVIALAYVCTLLALHMTVPLVHAALTTMVVVAAFVFLPQGPGFVGTWQAGCVFALGLFSVSKEVAVGFSLLSWAGMMGSNLLGGAVFLMREDLALRDVLRAGREQTGVIDR
jgi:glycosyltransferase 2 family protein